MNNSPSFSYLEPLESRIAPAVFVVTNLSEVPSAGQMTLREAVTAANAHANVHGIADTIIFKHGLTGKLTLTGGELGDHREREHRGAGRGEIDGGWEWGVSDFRRG